MFIVQHKTVILKVLLSIMRRKVVHGKVQGQRQKDRKVVGILATLLHSLTKIIESNVSVKLKLQDPWKSCFHGIFEKDYFFTILSRKFRETNC